VIHVNCNSTNFLSYLTDQLNDLKQRGTYFKLRVLEDEQALSADVLLLSCPVYSFA
jgi:hypothetical protein